MPAYGTGPSGPSHIPSWLVNVVIALATVILTSFVDAGVSTIVDTWVCVEVGGGTQRGCLGADEDVTDEDITDEDIERRSVVAPS